MRRKLLLIVAFCGAVSYTASAQSFMLELSAEPNAGKRAEKALLVADSAFDSAHDLYAKGDVHNADAQLDDMTLALSECVHSLQSIHKPGLYKKAELKVSDLQRRLSGLLDNINLDERGWAEYTSRKLDEIHDKLLTGVMTK